MKDGNPNSYPFDTYTGFLTIAAATLQSGDPIPLTIYSTGAVQGFISKVDFQAQQDGDDYDGSIVQLTFTIRRSNTTRLFSAIIFIREHSGSQKRALLELTARNSYVAS